MRPVLLCYNVKGEMARGITFLAMKMGIMLKAVPREDFDKPLGKLLGMETEEISDAQGKPFDEAMLVMAFFPQGMAGSFLNGMRAMKIPKIRLKAMLTDTNMHWNGMTLAEELAKESEALKNGATAHETKTEQENV